MTPVLPRRRSFRVRRSAPAALVILLVLVVTACGGDATSPVPGGSASPPGSLPPTMAPTDEPTETPTDAPTDEPTEAPTDEPTDAPSPDASGEPVETPAGAAACTGSDDNRAFYAAVAADVTWDVYCPVLPAGWFVETGSFRLANGGRLEISYKGPGGQRLEISQGFYCSDAECPTATDGAPAARFGDRAAALTEIDGDPAVVAGTQPGWLARGFSMEGDRLASYTAAFAKVGG